MARLNRSQVRRLERAASEGVVLIHQRDGSVKGFDKTEVQSELYLARLDAALGREPRPSEFRAALEAATPESRAAVLALDDGQHYADLDDPDEDSGLDDLSEP